MTLYQLPNVPKDKDELIRKEAFRRIAAAEATIIDNWINGNEGRWMAYDNRLRYWQKKIGQCRCKTGLTLQQLSIRTYL